MKPKYKVGAIVTPDIYRVQGTGEYRRLPNARAYRVVIANLLFGYVLEHIESKNIIKHLDILLPYDYEFTNDLNKILNSDE